MYLKKKKEKREKKRKNKDLDTDCLRPKNHLFDCKFRVKEKK